MYKSSRSSHLLSVLTPGDSQHTFVIDPASAEHLMRTNEDFKQLICSKQYIYADGHIVRNTPRYVLDQDGCMIP